VCVLVHTLYIRTDIFNEVNFSLYICSVHSSIYFFGTLLMKILVFLSQSWTFICTCRYFVSLCLHHFAIIRKIVLVVLYIIKMLPKYCKSDYFLLCLCAVNKKLCWKFSEN
jgi:hypothetical protein